MPFYGQLARWSNLREPPVRYTGCRYDQPKLQQHQSPWANPPFRLVSGRSSYTRDWISREAFCPTVVANSPRSRGLAGCLRQRASQINLNLASDPFPSGLQGRSWLGPALAFEPFAHLPAPNYSRTIRTWKISVEEYIASHPHFRRG